MGDSDITNAQKTKDDVLSKDKSSSPKAKRPVKDEATSPRKRKVLSLKKLLDSETYDVRSLRQLAISQHGLVKDALRTKIWPILVGVDVENIPPPPSDETLKAHRDYNQVVLDVNRSLKRFPPGMEETRRMSMQDQLVDVIMRVLVHRPELHYYQGFHDICVTFLLVVGEELTFAIMEKLAQNHLRDFMEKDMSRTQHMLNYLYPIIGKSSPKLRDFMEMAEVGTIFCLPWLITWFGHVLNDLGQIVRFYDFFLACHPLMPIYVASAIILHREDAILDCECEMCFVHQLLSRIPDDLPFERLVGRAGDLFIQHPPSELAPEAEQLRKLSEMEKKAEMQHSSIRKRRNLKPQFGKSKNEPVKTVAKQRASTLVKITIWGLVGAVGAATVAMVLNNYPTFRDFL